MQIERLLVFLPLIGLVVLVIFLYVPQLTLTFMDKTTILLTFALASFAAVEGFSTYKRASAEIKWHKLEDAKNELEKAYGPLYTILNKSMKSENSGFWLDFEERGKIDRIIATYPFMFPSNIIDLWQEKIRNLAIKFEPSDYKSGNYDAGFDVYLELKNLVNKEYVNKVKNYRNLLGK
jgi:hypothetical protein